MAKKCPLCHVDNKPTARFCGTCGTSLPEDTARAEEEEYSALTRFVVGVVALFCECFPGVFSPVVVVMSILATIVAAGIIGLAGGMFALGAVFSAFMIGAVGVICYWSACVWIVSGYMCLPSEGLADIRGPQWWAFFLIGFGPFLAILGVLASL